MTDPKPGSVAAARALLLVFVVSNLGYYALDPETPRFVPWLALYTLQFALLLGIFRLGPLRGREIVAGALVSRVLLWFTYPVMEADFYRYLWDGHVGAHGINPFLYAPADPALDAVETGYRFFVTHSEFSTIYPPVAQIVFRIAHALSADSLVALKAVLTAFDVATGVLLARWLTQRGHGAWAALYWLNPLVLKEIANSAHLDSVPVFFATAALYALSTSGPAGATLRSWIWLALSAGSKWYALGFVPLFVRVDPRWRRGLAGLALVLVLLYLPFAGAGTALFGGTAAFGRYWLFNASLFRLVAAAFGPLGDTGPLLARAAVVAIFAALVVWRARRMSGVEELPEAARFILAALLLLSPVVDAWYVLWILPLAVLTRSVPWLAFSWLVALSYSWFHSQALAPYFQLAEYTALFALLGLQAAWGPSIVAPCAQTDPET